MVGAHPRAEARGPAHPPVLEVRRPGAARPLTDRIPTPAWPPPAAWRPRGPATARALAATLLAPVALLAVAAVSGTVERPDVEWEETDLALGGYAAAAAVAFAGQLGVVAALVAMHRSRPGGDGNTSLILGGVVLTLSLAVLASPILGFFAFVAAAVAIPLLAGVAGPCALAALLGLLGADRTRAPAGWVVTCTGIAGWLMALIGMPVAGGILVLALGTL